MADTIHEQIAQALYTTLDAIDGCTCLRRTRRKLRQPLTNGLIVLFQDDPQVQEAPFGWKQWRAPFAVQAFAVLDDTCTTPVDTELNNLRGKIEAAAMAAPQWGGLALDTEIGPPVTPEPAEAYDLIQVAVNIDFRHLVANPFSQ